MYHSYIRAPRTPRVTNITSRASGDANNMTDIDIGCVKEEISRGREEEKGVNFDRNLD